MPSVEDINSISNHFIRGQSKFGMGKFMTCKFGEEQKMIDAVDALKAYLVHIRDNQVGGDLTGSDALDALVLANTLNTKLGITLTE